MSRVRSHLTRVFEASEEENRRVILEAVAGGPPRARLLDVGCDDGAFTVRLRDAARSSSVHGVELVQARADDARARGVDVAVADIEDGLPFAPAQFDLVHANQVIEHLRGTDAFLRELCRVCAPDGRVVLSTNNLASWHNIASLVLGFQPLPSHVSDELHVGNPLDPRRDVRHRDRHQAHLRVFTARALSDLAAANGLACEALAMNGYYPLLPPAARRLARVDPRHAAFTVIVLRRAAAR